MTNQEAKEKIFYQWQDFLEHNLDYAGISEAYKMALKALEQEPCEDVISRQYLLDNCVVDKVTMPYVPISKIQEAPSVNQQEPKTGHCKDCKYFRDIPYHIDICIQHTGLCPKGDWYCADFEPQERRDKE